MDLSQWTPRRWKIYIKKVALALSTEAEVYILCNEYRRANTLSNIILTQQSERAKERSKRWTMNSGSLQSEKLWAPSPD